MCPKSRWATPSTEHLAQPAWCAPWEPDPFVAEDGHHGPAKPSSGLLQGRKLVLDRLAAITGPTQGVPWTLPCCPALRGGMECVRAEFY